MDSEFKYHDYLICMFAYPFFLQKMVFSRKLSHRPKVPVKSTPCADSPKKMWLS